jgi:inorganic pyrophosphatase
MKHKTKSASKSSSNHVSSQVSVIVETPKGSRNKLKYDPATKMFKLSKVMPEGMMFPYDFGFVPSTKADDGDPLDVLVLTDEPLFPGCLTECVLIGAIEAKQEEEGKTKRNDRLIAVAQQSLLYSEVKDIEDLNPTVLKQIEAFFVNYQKVRDIKVTILGRQGPEKANEILQKSATRKHAA